MRKANRTTTHAAKDRAPAWSLWFAAAVLAVLIVAVIGTAWAVRHAIAGDLFFSKAQSRAVIALAEFPDLVRTAITEVRGWVEDSPRMLLIVRKKAEQPYWVRRFPAPEDPGYLLFAGVDPVARHSIVQLIRISDGTPVARWDPDWPALFERHTPKKDAPAGNPENGQAVHPLLLGDGDIIFNTNSTTASLVRLGPCSSKPIWVLDEDVHHSNELDASGAAVWVPSVSQDGLSDSSWLRDRIRDDALANFSLEGRLLDKRSFIRILRDNDMHAMVLGTIGVRANEDPIHMNQIQVALYNSRHWNRGDLLISSRGLSTVFLYRPSTGRILWHKTGPWMNQHSVDFVDGHRISVFDNNIVRGAPKEHAFLTPGDTNRVFLYDFDTKQASQPFAALLAEARPVTITEGRARVLPDGGLFIEETEYGRHLRFTRDRLLWSRVNDYDDQYIGLVSWSRYLTADEAKRPLQALASRQCPTTASAIR